MKNGLDDPCVFKYHFTNITLGMRAKISIAFLSISLIASFGLSSNQAFAGVTAQNDECVGQPDGTGCGNPADTECSNPDSCQGEVCDANNEPSGTPCGNPNDTMCNNPDSCNANGMCLRNFEPSGTPCDLDEDSCTTDQCEPPGVCVAGPSECVVGGEIIPIGTTSLILAGTQSAFSWMIPITVSAVGIAIVIAKKFSKYQPE